MSHPCQKRRAPNWLTTPAFLGFACLMVAYLATTAAYGRFASFDEVWYKCAGLDFAKHGTFAAHELVGFVNLEPSFDRVFGVYPPLYPFFFGLYTLAFGFGWRQISLFDASIHVLLCVAVALLVRHYSGKRLSTASWAAGSSMLFVGTLGRPDELAMVFAIASVIAAGFQASAKRDIASGVGLGLCAGASLSVAIVAGPTILLHLILRNGASLRGHVSSLAYVGLTAGLVLGAALLPVQLYEPGAFAQFFQLGKKFVAKGTFFDLWVKFAWQFGKPYLIHASLTTAFLAALLPRLWSRSRGVAIATSVGPAVGMLFVVLTMRGKFPYLWFVVPFMAAGAAAACHSLWRQVPAWQRWGILGAAAVITLLSNSWGALRHLVILTLPAEQTWAAAAAHLDATIPDGAVVLADEHWMTLGARCKVIDAHSTSPVALARVDYVVVTSNMSSKPGSRRKLTTDLEQVIARDFIVFGDHLSRHVPTVLGERLFNSAYGFGPLVMRRGSAQAKR